MPTENLTTIDLSNRFYCNVDIDSEVAMKLLTLAIKKGMAEHSLHNLKVKFNPAEYKETVEAIKYVFGVAKEQGLVNDRFMYAAASDSYNDVLLTGKFQTDLAHAICEEFNITPIRPAWWMRWFATEVMIHFHLPQGPENQRLSIEKMLKIIEVTAGNAAANAEKKAKLARKDILDEEDRIIGGRFADHASFMDSGMDFPLSSGLRDFTPRTQK